MDKLNHYRQIIVTVLDPYSQISYANVNIRNRKIFDLVNDQYLILSEGWENQRHIHSCLIHIEILNHKVWIQCDNTEYGITNDLLKAGISQEDIVLGFQEPAVRKYTGFGVA